MTIVTHGLRTYDIDRDGFLRDPRDWDEDFAGLMAPQVGLTESLTSEHWEVIRAIRKVFDETGTLFARGLGRPVASLRAESHRIIDAMDAVVSGV